MTVPTTLVWGDGDIASGPVAVQMCEQLVGRPYRLVVLEGVSHWVPDQRPAAVADAVLEPAHLRPPRVRPPRARLLALGRLAT